MSKRFVIYLLAALLIAIFVALSLLSGKNNIRQQHQISREIESYEKTIDSLQKVIDDRNETIERLKHDSLYIEEQLRTKYGMSRPGERVFQYVK